MEKDDIIYVAGHTGMVGSAILKKLIQSGYRNLVYVSSSIVDLRTQQHVNSFFEHYKPEYVFLCAAKVGGIMANNTYRGEFIYDNLMIAANVIHAAHLYGNGQTKLLNLGSSCIYPKNAAQPMKEEALLTGSLEPTNEPYAIAKIAAIKMCQSYHDQYGCNSISAMPTNLYGDGDNYDQDTSHVIPALIRKFHEAKVNNSPNVELWGDGTPMREFMHVDDLADACIFLMNNYDGREVINVGSGQELSINELAYIIRTIVGYTGGITFDSSKPNGSPRKLMDSSKINKLGWHHSITLVNGLAQTYQNFLDQNF